MSTCVGAVDELPSSAEARVVLVNRISFSQLHLALRASPILKLARHT
jgi:hypothetical protein